MSSLAQEVGDDPVLLSQLDRIDAEREQLAAAEPASDQHGEDRVVPLATEGIAVCTGQKPLALLGREPVPNTDTNPADSFDASNSGCQFWTEQSGIGGLVRDPPNGRQAKINRCRRVLFLFEIDPVSEDHGAIEREARF